MITPARSTIEGLTFATPVAVSPEYIRLPSPGKTDPMFGLSRSYLNLLVLPSKENDLHPPVLSSVLRQSGARTGVRLVNVASLSTYLKNQLGTEEQKSPATSSGNGAKTNSHVEFLRLPKAKERDPLFGLSRSFLNELILSCAKNGYHPPVKSHLLRRRGHRTGVRLISVDSLRVYIQEHEEPTASNGAEKGAMTY